MILRSKLRQPSVSGAYIDRPRLYRILGRWQALRALMIRAPAGYGKSSLVSRWLTNANNQVPAAWLALDEPDSNPSEFVRYVAAALDPFVPGVLAAVEPILDYSNADPQRALTQLLVVVQDAVTSDVQPPSRHLLLVLDDLHRVASPAVNALLMMIIERGPPNLHLFLLTRRTLTLPLARLYADEQIDELGVDDLRFTAEEVRCYLRQRGLKQLDETDLDTIMQRSEGWVIALQLATLAQRGRGDLGGLLANLHGNSRWLADYLTGEVLAQQTPEVRRFLLQTAILDDFTPALCAAVTGCEDAHRLLGELADADLLLIALDEQHTQFRYHHLFRELLRRHLHAVEGKAQLKALHCRAAAWLADADRVPAAVRHLRAVGEASAAVDLVATHVQPVILRDPRSARQLIELLPEELLLQHPQLMLDRCRLEMLFDNKELITQVALAETALTQAELEEPQASIQWARLQAYRAMASFLQADIAATVRHIQQAQHGLRYLDNFDRGALAFLQAHLCIYEGRHSDIRYHATRAMAAFAQIDFAAGILAIQRELARYAFRIGSSSEANAQFEAIFASQSSNQPLVTLDLWRAYLDAAEHSYWQNNLAQARAYYQQALRLAQCLQDTQMLTTMTWYDALLAYAERVETATGQGCISLPPTIEFETDKRYVDLQVRLLVLARRFEEAWRIAEDLGPQLDSDPAAFSNRILMPFLQAYIARGIALPAIMPLLERTLEQRHNSGDRFYELQLLMLKAWQESQLEYHSEALITLTHAAKLALETGYLRVILDIPNLLTLLEQISDPAIGTETLRAGYIPPYNPTDLTAQEQVVLQLLAQDYRYEQVAQKLTISINTVRTHVRHIYKKLGANRRAKALQLAQGMGLIRNV